MGNYLPKIIGMGEFQKWGAQILKKFKKDLTEAILFSHNKPMAVILSLTRYNELRKIEENKGVTKTKRRKKKKLSTGKKKKKKKKNPARLKGLKKRGKTSKAKTRSKKRMKKI